MKRIIAGICAGLVLGAVPASAANAPSTPGPEKKPRWMTTPCQGENDYACYYDKKGRRSYWAIPLADGKVAIVYWNRRYNLRRGFVTGR